MEEALRTYLRWKQWLINEFERRIHKGVQHFCRSVLEDFGDIYIHGNLLHSSQEWLLLVISTLINRISININRGSLKFRVQDLKFRTIASIRDINSP